MVLAAVLQQAKENLNKQTDRRKKRILLIYIMLDIRITKKKKWPQKA